MGAKQPAFVLHAPHHDARSNAEGLGSSLHILLRCPVRVSVVATSTSHPVPSQASRMVSGTAISRSVQVMSRP
jgi:hypothetical protein